MEGKISFGSYAAAAETLYATRGRRTPAVAPAQVDNGVLGRVKDAPVAASTHDTERKVRAALKVFTAPKPAPKRQPAAVRQQGPTHVESGPSPADSHMAFGAPLPQTTVETTSLASKLPAQDIPAAPLHLFENVQEEAEVTAMEEIVAEARAVENSSASEILEDEIVPAASTVTTPVSVVHVIDEADQSDLDDDEPEAFSVEAVLRTAVYDEDRMAVPEAPPIVPVAVEAPDVVHEEVENAAPQLERLEIPPLGLCAEDQRAIGVQLHLLQQAGKLDKAHIRKACEMVFGLHGTDRSLIGGVVQMLAEELTLQTVQHVPQDTVVQDLSAEVQPIPVPESTVVSNEALRQLEHELLHGVSGARVHARTKVHMALTAPAASKTEFVPESFSETDDVMEEGDVVRCDSPDDELGYDDVSFEDIDFEALGIDPGGPTQAKPGTEEKVLMLAARYQAGVPLWHDKDCYEHGHAALETMMAKFGGHPKGS